MMQITATDTNEFSNNAEFIPVRGFSNCHLQTMLPCLFRHQVKFTLYWQRLELPNGGFVDLTWSGNPAQARRKPCLAVFHGLEGSLSSLYTHSLVEAAQKHGQLGVMVHFRGRSSEPNRMHRTYHSGETKDASWSLRWLQREFGHTPAAAVGYSLDGNILAYLLTKESNDLPIDTAMVISASFVLEACSYHMEKGSSRVCRRYLLNPLEANTIRELAVYPGTLPINFAQLKSVRRTRKFDDLVTTRIHGYADTINYYRQCSTMPMLNRIAKPTLVIHVRDDPFMDHQVILKPGSPPPQVGYQLTERGGHVGSIGDTLLHPQIWLESRIPDWLATYLEARSCRFRGKTSPPRRWKI